MRRLAALALIAALAPFLGAAKDVDIPDKPRPMRVIPSPPRPAKPAPEPPAISLPPSAPAARASADQCSLSCAQTYYFCLAAEETGSCSPEWGQCRARCSPSVTPDWRWERRR